MGSIYDEGTTIRVTALTLSRVKRIAKWMEEHARDRPRPTSWPEAVAYAVRTTERAIHNKKRQPSGQDQACG